MNICIDFDGTCVSHEFPETGKEIGAIPVLKELVAAGHGIILFTMRDDVEIEEDLEEVEGLKPRSGQHLSNAVKWFKDNDIPLYGIQKNPQQHTWTGSPKAYGHIYIDDAALGCPLIYDPDFCKRAYVDWVLVRNLLVAKGFLTDE